MKREAKLVGEAMTNWCGKKVKVSVVEGLPSTLLVLTPFLNSERETLYFYAYLRKDSKHLILSDAGRMLNTASGLGVSLPMDTLQKVAHSYGLFIAEDNSIIDSTKRPLGERIGSLIQLCMTIDGLIRVWNSAKENIKDAESKEIGA